MLLKQTFQKQNPHASDLKFLPGAEEMTEPTAPMGSSFSVPMNTKFSCSLLPKKTWGVTAVFQLDPNFSEFDLRRAEDTISGKLMQKFSDQLGEGPNFVCTDGKSDVMHVDCLPERRAHDTTNWKPALNDGTVKVIQTPGTHNESYLVVDIPQLKNALRAYENTFAASTKKVSTLTVASHHVNRTLEVTAIRNACKIAKQFSELSGVSLCTSSRDIYAVNPSDTLPVPCAISVDNPFSTSEVNSNRTVTISSGIRSGSGKYPLPLVVSPGKFCTYISELPPSSTTRLPAYFSENKVRGQVNQLNHTFHRERYFYPNKPASVDSSVIQKLLPEVDDQKYNEFAKDLCALPLKSLQTIAVFTV